MSCRNFWISFNFPPPPLHSWFLLESMVATYELIDLSFADSDKHIEIFFFLMMNFNVITRDANKFKAIACRFLIWISEFDIEVKWFNRNFIWYFKFEIANTTHFIQYGCDVINTLFSFFESVLIVEYKLN